MQQYRAMSKATLTAEVARLQKEQHAQARLGNVKTSSHLAGELVTATLALAEKG